MNAKSQKKRFALIEQKLSGLEQKLDGEFRNVNYGLTIVLVVLVPLVLWALYQLTELTGKTDKLFQALKSVSVAVAERNRCIELLQKHTQELINKTKLLADASQKTAKASSGPVLKIVQQSTEEEDRVGVAKDSQTEQ